MPKGKNELKKTNFNLAQFEKNCYQNKVIPVFELGSEGGIH